MALLDISFVQEKSFDRSKYWLLAINDATDFFLSKFMKSKDQTSTTMVSLIWDLKNEEGVVVKKICCNNVGENVAFQQNTKKEGLGLNFKFMACTTPQQNGRVECKFATLFGRVQLMLNLARLVNASKDLHKGLWAECTNTTTKMENAATRSNKEPPYCQIFKRDPPFIHLLWAFGEIGIVHNKKKICTKLENQDVISMFVGYAANHARDKFKMLSLITKQIWQSCNIKWIAPSLPAYAALQLACLKAGWKWQWWTICQATTSLMLTSCL